MFGTGVSSLATAAGATGMSDVVDADLVRFFGCLQRMGEPRMH